jgi:hypothetical protein
MGPPGIVETTYIENDTDQGIAGASVNGAHAPTPVPARLTVAAEAGTYLLTWSAEFMRTSGGFPRVYARLRDVTAGESVAVTRVSAPEAGPSAAIPPDTNNNDSGEIILFSGSRVVVLPDGVKQYELQYGMNSASGASVALRVRRQRVGLVKLE